MRTADSALVHMGAHDGRDALAPAAAGFELGLDWERRRSFMRGWVMLGVLAWASTAAANECASRVAKPPEAADFEENSRRVCAAWPKRPGCSGSEAAPDTAGSLRYFEAKASSEPCVAYYVLNLAELLDAAGRRVEAYAMYRRASALEAPPPGALRDAPRAALMTLIGRARARLPELEQHLAFLQLDSSAPTSEGAEVAATVILWPRNGGGTLMKLDAGEVARHVRDQSPLVLEPGEYALDVGVSGCAARSETLRLGPGPSRRTLLDSTCEASPSSRLGVLTRLDVALHSQPGGALRAGLSLAPSRAVHADASLVAAPHNGGLAVGVTYWPFSTAVLSHVGVGLAAIGLWPWPRSEVSSGSLGAEAAVHVALPWEGARPFAALGLQYYAVRPEELYSPALVVLSVGSRWGEP